MSEVYVHQDGQETKKAPYLHYGNEVSYNTDAGEEDLF